VVARDLLDVHAGLYGLELSPERPGLSALGLLDLTDALVVGTGYNHFTSSLTWRLGWLLNGARAAPLSYAFSHAVAS
jgi:hypothetical protein